HGAVKGQNGFRLSLFGADPSLDHERLYREFAGRRLNLVDPDASLLLLKGTGKAPHQGGVKLPRGGPEYQIIRSWIAQGAALDAAEQSAVTQLTAQPASQTIKPGTRHPLRIV